MHANVNQIRERKVLDEQVKTKIFKAFRQSCFLFDETSGQCAYMGRFVNAVGSVASCYALSGIRTSSLVKTHCRRWQSLVGTWPTTAFFRLLYKSLYMNFHCQSVCSSSNCMIKTDYTLYFIETVGNLFQFCLQ